MNVGNRSNCGNSIVVERFGNATSVTSGCLRDAVPEQFRELNATCSSLPFRGTAIRNAMREPFIMGAATFADSDELWERRNSAEARPSQCSEVVFTSATTCAYSAFAVGARASYGQCSAAHSESIDDRANHVKTSSAASGSVGIDRNRIDAHSPDRIMRARRDQISDRITAVGYVRVSTAEQAKSGFSISDQQRALTDEASRRGWDLVFAVDEGFSGASLNRPRAFAALEILANGDADVLLVTRLDRLSRSVGDIASVMKRSLTEGWSIVALDLGVDTTTPTGELVAHVMASFAHFERRLMRDRTMAGKAEKARRGQGWIVGQVPYGYRSVAGDLTPAPAEARVVRFIFRKTSKGMMRKKIARILNEELIEAPGGGVWTAAAVRRIVRREVYCGRYESCGHTVRVHALIGRGLWLRAQRPTIGTPEGRQRIREERSA